MSYRMRIREESREKGKVTKVTIATETTEGVFFNGSGCSDIVGSMLLSFVCFLRAGDCTVPRERAYDPMAYLNKKNIAVDNLASPSTIRVTIKQAKTENGLTWKILLEPHPVIWLSGVQPDNSSSRMVNT